jgi:hypothetical protein
LAAAMGDDEPSEQQRRRERAEQIVWLAWMELPAPDRQLLVSIGASQWEVSSQPLGRRASALLSSAGMPALLGQAIADLDRAAGVWIAQLRVVLINCAHPALEDLDERTYEAMLARVAWHEWAHALSVARAGWDDVAAGARLVALAPDGIRGFIRQAGYRRGEYTHELVAEIYALLMSRRRRGQTGQPSWLDDEIYELVRRVSGWSE